MKVRTLSSRRPSGAITPKNYWRLYAENAVAPLRRKSGGAITPKTKWLLYAENSQRDSNLPIIQRPTGPERTRLPMQGEEAKSARFITVAPVAWFRG